MVSFDRALVTGVAGFVGSHLAERLLTSGVAVRGIDCLTPYYSETIKQRNLQPLEGFPSFEFEHADLASDDLSRHLADVDVVFHQAAQPGVRSSWATGFEISVRNNVVATQRLLEAVKEAGVQRFVYASSSSVYGEGVETPTKEEAQLRPFSPYGVTKLSGEQLCSVYARNWGVDTVALRYFTVYGPRQRPDMATHRLIQAALNGTAFPLFSSADHVRDFTYVSDIVDANIAAATARDNATVVNVAGGGLTSMSELMTIVEEVTGRPVTVDHLAKQAGDVTHTEADLTRARSSLDWRPQVGLRDGVAAQVEWHRENSSLLASVGD